MIIDIVQPKNNENAFIEMAKKLGYDGLVFLYGELKCVRKIADSKIKIFTAIYSDKIPRKTLLNVSNSDNRKLVEKGKIDILFNQETYHQKDSMHFRYSGLNHISAKMMANNDIIYAISLSTILNSKERPKLLGKIMQNIRLCQKFKAKVSIFSFAKSPYEMRSPKDLVAILSVLGANTKTQKNNFSNLYNKIVYNEKVKKGLILEEGIEIIE